MKINLEHQKEVRSAILRFCRDYTSNGREDALKNYLERLAQDPKVTDVSKRLRWDLYRATKFACMSEIYEYANDEHIDTLLRDVMCVVSRDYL